jgi:hypothetical protein
VKSSPAYNERKVAMNRDRERERRENQLNGNMFSIFGDVGKSPNGGVNGEVIKKQHRIKWGYDHNNK